jgi:hypothetical protein
MVPHRPALIAASSLLSERGRNTRRVHENPEDFIFKSTNFDLLSVLWDQSSEQDRELLLDNLLSRISSKESYRHIPGSLDNAGTWRQCTSELPLVAEFLVRRKATELLIMSLRTAALNPGLTLMLAQLGDMIAFCFTLFADEEYKRLRTEIGIAKPIIAAQTKSPGGYGIENYTARSVGREGPIMCDAILEASRKAQYLYVKGALLPGMNLEVNQDKATVLTFLQKLASRSF